MKALGLCTGDKFTLIDGTDQGLEFVSWTHDRRAMCKGYPDVSTYGRVFPTDIGYDTEVYVIEGTTLTTAQQEQQLRELEASERARADQELRDAHAKLRGFVATVKQGRTTHEVTGYAPTLDRAEEIIRHEFRGMLGTSHRYIGVRWAQDQDQEG